jgi:hypothetical protein
MMRIILTIAVFGCLISCTWREVKTVQDLTDFVSDADNGLTKTVDANGYTIQLMYQPTDLWVAREVRDSVKDASNILAAVNKYEAYYYFVLSISKDSKEALNSFSSSEQSDLVTTLSFRTSEFVTLTTSRNDTIALGESLFDRMYGRSNANTVLLVFERPKLTSDEWVEVNVEEFGMRTGSQSFRFRTKDFLDAPRLEFTAKKTSI